MESRVTKRLGLRQPIVQGPFGGGLSSVALAATVSDAGGLGSFGVHHLDPHAIAAVAAELRAATRGPFNLNLWVSDHDLPAEEMTPERFDAAVGRLRRPVFRLLLAELGDRDLADTLTQECFLRAWRARHRFRGDCPVDGWILRIAANLARDHRKSRAQGFWRRLLRLDAEPDADRVAASPPDPGPDPERSMLQREALKRVYRGLIEAEVPFASNAVTVKEGSGKSGAAAIAAVPPPTPLVPAAE